jgi:hypothetical protein
VLERLIQRSHDSRYQVLASEERGGRVHERVTGGVRATTPWPPGATNGAQALHDGARSEHDESTPARQVAKFAAARRFDRKLLPRTSQREKRLLVGGATSQRLPGGEDRAPLRRGESFDAGMENSCAMQ